MEGAGFAIMRNLTHTQAMELPLLLLPKSFGEGEDLHDPIASLLPLLASCRGWEDLASVRRVHSFALRSSRASAALNNALLSAYCRCNAPSEAHRLLDEVSEAYDAAAWNALIVAYAKNGMPLEAIACFRNSRCKSNAWYERCRLHEGRMYPRMWYRCPMVYGMLDKRNMCPEGDMLYGGNLWHKGSIGSRSNVWYARNLWYKRNMWCKRGTCSESNRMHWRILSPGPYTLVCLLKACGQVRNVEMGEEIYAEVCNRGLLERNVFLCNALLDMYAKCGLMLKAQEVFDRLQLRDVVTWNSLICGYLHNGYAHKALNCFKLMREEDIAPDEVTLLCILKACGIVRCLEMGEEIHFELQKWRRLWEKNVDVWNSLMAMYSKCCMLEKAQEVFNKLKMRNVASWNVLIDGYTQHELGSAALKCFEQMCHEGITPDEYTYVCVLKACTITGSLNVGMAIHAEIRKKSLIGKNPILGNAIVHMYAKWGVLGKAQAAFNELTERDIISWNSLISGYAQHGFNDEALNCFMRLIDEGISPDAFTFVGALNACSGIGLLEIGEKIHGEVCDQGLIKDNMVLGNALVSMYAKCCMPGRAQEVFDELLVPDVISWNALISGYAQLGEVRKVLYLFYKMLIEAAVLPDFVTFIILLTTCSHGGLVDEGQLLLYDVVTLYSMKPTIEHYTCMVDLFGRAGRVDKAVAMLAKVPYSERLPMWLALLGACCKWANVDLGRWAFEQSVMLDEKCAIAYVCMGNIYAAVRMYKEAMGIEARRLEKGAWHSPWHSGGESCMNMDRLARDEAFVKRDVVASHLASLGLPSFMSSLTSMHRNQPL
jgi:pentatricopeptide repeat protein